jgi:hypothetical protein
MNLTFDSYSYGSKKHKGRAAHGMALLGLEYASLEFIGTRIQGLFATAMPHVCTTVCAHLFAAADATVRSATVPE